ncbi:Formate dehydrogenase-O, major subunit protein [Minicystis rosea]|nr:Formate dehydrogenase-O, major subunit protein [Minicystis rosea]
MSEHKYRTCNLCEAMCGLDMTVEGDRITDVRGDDADVFSRGHICPKGPAMRDLYEDPDRLRRPLVRKDGKLVPASWEEALEAAADGILRVQRKYGRNAVGVYSGNPTAHNHGALIMGQMLLSALRTRNRFDANSQDANPRLFTAIHMFGEATALTVPDVDRTDYFLVLGANPAASNGSIMSLGDVRGRLKGIRARGGKMVLVDPRRTETAAWADEHLFIRPGGDAALLLAILHVIFAEKRCDEAAVRAIADGLDELQTIAARFAPERVASAIGMEAGTIRRIADEFSGAKRAVAYGRVGICTSEFGSLGSWLIEALNVVTGNFDRPGGSMFPKPAIDLSGLARKLGVGGAGRYRSRVRGLPEVSGMLPATTIVDEIETPGEGQIRALVTIAGNPVLSVPGGERLARALPQLEHMVSIDIYANETTRHASVILPPRSALERGHYDVLFHAIQVRNTAKWSEPVVKPDPDTRDDWSILWDLSVRLHGKRRGPLAERAARLALRLGAPSDERVLDLLLRTGPYQGLSLAALRAAPHGVDLGPLVPMRASRVRTPSQRVRLTPPALAADLPRLDRWLAEPQPGDLLLIGRRHVRSNNSWMHNLRPLVKGRDRATLQMHPEDAARLGLADGATVQVKSRAGEVRAKLEVTDEVMRGIVSLPHGFGHASAADTLRVAGSVPGPNANEVTDAAFLEPLTGTAILNGVVVSVAAVAATGTVLAAQ